MNLNWASWQVELDTYTYKIHLILETALTGLATALTLDKFFKFTITITLEMTELKNAWLEFRTFN